MANVRTIYSRKQTKHWILGYATNQTVEEDQSESAHVVIIWPPTGNRDNDIENEDNNSQQENDLPKEDAGEEEDAAFTHGDEDDDGNEADTSGDESARKRK